MDDLITIMSIGALGGVWCYSHWWAAERANHQHFPYRLAFAVIFGCVGIFVSLMCLVFVAAITA